MQHRRTILVLVLGSCLACAGCSSSSERALTEAKAEAASAKAELAKLKAQQDTTTAAPAPKGPLVEKVSLPPFFLELFSDSNVKEMGVFKYTGTYVDCFVEAEIDGKWVVLQQTFGAFQESMDKAAKEASGELEKAGKGKSAFAGGGGGHICWRIDTSYPKKMVSNLRVSASSGSGGWQNATPATLLSVEDGYPIVGHSFTPVAQLPASLTKEVILLKGTVYYAADVAKKVERKVRLKCQPSSPEAEAGK